MTAPLIDIYDRTYLNPQINTVVNDYTGRTYPMQQNIPVLLHEYYMDGLKQYRRFSGWLGSRYAASGKLVDKLLGRGISTAKKQMLADLELKNGDRVLCLSVGNGADLNFLPEDMDSSSLQITGADISLSLLQQCRKALDKKGMQAQLINCCMEALPFEDSYFDAVFMMDGLETCSDNRKAIAEMMRVVKRGGRALIAGENRKGNDAATIQALLPDNAAGIVSDTYMKNKLYSLRFRKPLL